ncbi:RNA polymerase sigma-B factor [Oikeobacillus pervagus]|uniref:RNA polymerase sigma-B factor n=1 Tax=Oikeobacillus pervagus TaxID=1325931 RepID=A0AAJ1T3K7_9BACI|nr:RNA polymerase sigma factor SigB [Oikeobacillus pervagus]MDQ0216597.1 RNA polymerase sigma-B factor [Oikeobacillus pervagus]
MSKPSQPNKSSDEQVLDWIKRFQLKEDEEALNRLVAYYQSLVVSLARRYSMGKSFHEDIIQVGMIGLLGAIRRYDASVGKSFKAFAIPTIVGEIKRFLRDKTWSVHVPRKIKEIGPKIKASVEELTATYERSPKVEEIAEHLGVTTEEVLEAMEMGKSYNALSVDHTIESDSDGSTITLLDIIGNEEEGYEKVDQKLVLERVLHVLTDREKQVIQLTFIENMSQKDAGEKIGISQMHVSRLQRRAIKKLKKAIYTDVSNAESSM